MIRSCLASIPVYLLSFFKFPKWALELINSQMSQCLWNDSKEKKRVHLANWDLVCMPKEFGGLGIPCLRDVNRCLLASWVKRYFGSGNRIWKNIVDSKYKTTNPNIFCSSTVNVSRFWKGFMWAADAVRFGYKWNLGNGAQVRFWEDTWFGVSPLCVQFWDLYCVCNETMVEVRKVWDGVNLKLTFRRNFSPALLQKWFELEQIAGSIRLSDDCDSIIWVYDSKGVYSTSSIYKIFSFRSVTQVYTPAVWSLVIPPRVQIFLWLLSNNKLMTRDNLLKRKMHKPTDCVFCKELEPIDHLFFECIIAKEIWYYVSIFFGFNIGSNFLSLATFWISNKKHASTNAICAAVLWGIWKFRNALIFDNQTWLCMKQVWWQILKSIKKWRLIFKPHMLERIDSFEQLIQGKLREIPALPWG